MAALSLHELSMLVDSALKAANLLKHPTLAYLLAMASLEVSLLIEKDEGERPQLPLAS